MTTIIPTQEAFYEQLRHVETGRIYAVVTAWESGDVVGVAGPFTDEYAEVHAPDDEEFSDDLCAWVNAHYLEFEDAGYWN